MNKKSIVIIIILVLALVSFPSVKPQSTQSRGANNTTASFTRTILYHASTYDVTHITNANNVAYLSTLNGTVYAFNASNVDVLWSFYAYEGVSSSDILTVRPFAPSLSVSDGIVFIGSIGAVYALNASTGAVIWKVPVHPVHASPVVANGVVFIGDTDNSVYAFNASNGIELWHSILGSSFYLIYSTPVISNGVLFIGSGNSNVYAINATTGVQLWSYNTGVGVFSSPRVFNGIVYVNNDVGFYFALNSTDGSRLDVDNNIIANILSGTLAVVGQSEVFIGAPLYSGYLYSFSASDYAKLWSWTSNFGMVESSPIVVDGVVLIVCSAVNGDVLYALNVTDGEQLWSYPLWTDQNGGASLSYFSYANGILYVQPYQSNLYAYNISSAFPSLDISILSPVSERYNDSSVPLVFLVGDQASWLAYSLDTYQNVTLSGNSTISKVPNGLHNLTVYANDTYGHMVSKTVAFSVEKPAPFPFMYVVVASGASIAIIFISIMLYRRRRKTVLVKKTMPNLHMHIVSVLKLAL